VVHLDRCRAWLVTGTASIPDGDDRERRLQLEHDRRLAERRRSTETGGTRIFGCRRCSEATYLDALKTMDQMDAAMEESKLWHEVYVLKSRGTSVDYDDPVAPPSTGGTKA
jgi:hypothetical protein